MEDQGVFKTKAFGGFEKKTVLTYVDELNQRFSEQEGMLMARIDELTEANKRMSAIVGDYETKLTELRQEDERKQVRLDECDRLLGETIDLVEQQKAILAEHDRESKIQTERSRQLQDRVDELEKERYSYDRLSAEVGDIMIQARKNAYSIELKGNLTAQEIVKEAAHSVEDFARYLNQLKAQSKLIRSAIQEAVAAFEVKLDDVDAQIHTTHGDIVEQVQSINVKVEQFMQSHEQDTDTSKEGSFFQPGVR